MIRHDDRPPLAPVWLSNAAALGWRILVLFVLVVVLAELTVILGTVVASIVFAAIVAVLFAPVAARLRDRGWSRTKTAGVVTLLAILVIGLIVVVLALAVLPFVPQIVDALQSGIARLQADVAASGQSSQLDETVSQAQSNAESWIANELLNVASWVGMAVTVTILGSITTFFLLQDGDKAWVWALQAAGDWQRERIMDRGDSALSGVGIWLRGTAAQAAVDAVTDFVFLLVLGVPAALALSIFVFFASFIPYLGGILVMAVLLVAAYATGGIGAAAALFVGVMVVNIFQTYVLGPRVFQGAVRMHPAVVLIALPIGATVAGFIGLFLAVPVVAFGFAIAGSLIDAIGFNPSGDDQTSDSIVPVWLDRLAQWGWRILIGMGFLVVAVLLAVQVPMVLIPVTLAIILASTFAPAYRLLRARGWSPTNAAATVTVATIAVTTVVVVLTVVSLATQMEPVVQAATAGAQQAVGSSSETLAWLQPVVATSGDVLREAAQALIAGSIGLTVIVIIGVLLTFYFMRDGSKLWSFATARLTEWRREDVDAAGGRAVNVLGGYMIGTGAISLFGAITQFAIMWLLGIPLALPLAVLAFFGGFIPYIGSFLTTGLAFLVTVALGTTTDAAIMGVYTIVFNIVQGNFVAPIVYGRAVNIHPAIVLLAIPAGMALAGIAGMFLVVPVIGVIATTWRMALRVFADGPAPAADGGGSVPTGAVSPALGDAGS
jgi:putative heme transporter